MPAPSTTTCRGVGGGCRSAGRCAGANTTPPLPLPLPPPPLGCSPRTGRLRAARIWRSNHQTREAGLDTLYRLRGPVPLLVPLREGDPQDLALTLAAAPTLAVGLAPVGAGASPAAALVLALAAGAVLPSSPPSSSALAAGWADGCSASLAVEVAAREVGPSSAGPAGSAAGASPSALLLAVAAAAGPGASPAGCPSAP